MQRFIYVLALSISVLCGVCTAQDSGEKYKLLATTRTSTLQKEVTEAQEAGFKVIGMVSRDEHMVVMERER